MVIEKASFNINGDVIHLIATRYEEGDKEKLKDLYHKWLTLNLEIKQISTRGINIPEAITENVFCIVNENCIRVVKLKKGKCSFDVLNTKSGSKIQIKASSIEGDLTSFGPRSEWDELFFMDFSKGDGSFKIYRIDKELIYSHQVNVSQTFEDQQKLGRRPRFSITKNIISLNKLTPVAEYDSMWNRLD